MGTASTSHVTADGPGRAEPPAPDGRTAADPAAELDVDDVRALLHELRLRRRLRAGD